MLAPWRHDPLNLSQNVAAGLIVAFLIVPQALGYGLLANVPPHVALAATILPIIAYAMFGGSRALAVGPVAIVSLMVAEATTAMDPDQLLLAVHLLALLVGATLITIRLLNLGNLVNFIGHPVIQGFTSAAAILIIIKQLELMIGDTIEPLWRVKDWHLASTVISALSLLLLVASKRYGPSPVNKLGPLLVLVLGMITAFFAPHLNVQTIEFAANNQIFTPFFPTTGEASALYDLSIQLFPSAIIIALLVFLESTSVAKVVAKRHDERIYPNQELMGLGTSNIVAGLAGAFPVAGGFGRTMVNEQAGATSPLAGVFTALFVLLFILLLPETISYMMKPVLGAIIAVAVWSLIDISPLYKNWKLHPQDNAVWLGSFFGVFILGVELGILLGVALSIIFLLRNAARPHIAIIGRIPGTSHFRNVKRHKVETCPNLLAIRIDEGLTFANRDNIEDFINQSLINYDETKHLLLVFSAVNQIDSDGLELLESLIRKQKAKGITVHLAEVKGPIMDKLEQLEIGSLLSPGKIYLSTDQAFNVLTQNNESGT